MESKLLYDKTHQWVVFGRDPAKPEKIIDTNQYMVVSGERAILLDPGGIEIFSSMLGSVLHYVNINQITDLFASHQDPDIISSLGLWDQALPQARLHAPWLWEGFLRHFGTKHIEYMAIADEGGSVDIGLARLEFIPAHYVHASGNFHVYDPHAKILMSGDVGACLEEPGAPMFVENFQEQIPKMKLFHQRWMPSNKAKNDWIRRVRELDIEIMAPQHGRIFQGENVKLFLDWFEQLEVGIAISSEN
ncbi:MAG: FprA family A-type flavoprotein [Gammaproteobacteria bacterium]|nr:FprA family A-type flavoprotein [Gammaproteobacteria bacterium]MDH5731727.1 FprA family A-type flavoprotein [Gammaproteobacteria bacterium]